MGNDAYKSALEFMEKGVGTYDNKPPPWYIDFGGAKYEIEVDGDQFSGTIGFGTKPRGAGFHFASVGRDWLRQHPGAEDAYDKALQTFAKKNASVIERNIKEKLFDDGYRIKREAFGYNNSEADEYGDFKNVRLQMKIGSSVKATAWERYIPVVVKFTATAPRLKATSNSPLSDMSDRELNQAIRDYIDPEVLTMGGELRRNGVPRRMQQLRDELRGYSPRQQQQFLRRPKYGSRVDDQLTARVADLTLRAHPEYGTTMVDGDGYQMRYPSVLIRTQPDYGESMANLPRGDALVQRHASTNTECNFYKATDGKWYMDLESYDENDDGEQIEGEMTSYGPFPSFKAAEKYLERNFANPGGWTEDDSGRLRPPRNPVRPRGRRWAFNKYSPDELLTQLVGVLEKAELNDAVRSIKKVTPDIQRAWRGRELFASASRVAARHLVAYDANEVASLYLHLSNGGATFSVIDAGNGPELVCEIGSFGEMDARVHIRTNAENLRRIADMLHIAAGHEGFSTHWDDNGGLSADDDQFNTYETRNLLPSMGASLAWWKARQDAKGYGKFSVEELVQNYRDMLEGYRAHFNGEDKSVDTGDDPDMNKPMPPAARVAARHLEARNPPLHEAAKADEAMGQAYNSLVALKMGFDSWEEIPPSAIKLYDLIGKAMSAVGKVRQDYTYQIRMQVQRKRYAARPDSDARYKANVKDARSLLKQIGDLITKHEREQASNTQDWGYPGDIGHVKQLLEEVNRFLSGGR